MVFATERGFSLPATANAKLFRAQETTPLLFGPGGFLD